MTSPISSDWFYHITMASISRALPASHEAGSPTTAAGIGADLNSLFSMLLNAAMEAGQSNATASLPFAETPLLSQSVSTYQPDNPPRVYLQNISANPIVATETKSPTDTSDLKFKPAQFMKLENSLEGKLSGAAAHFIGAGKKYDIDPNLLSAIAIHETGNGSSRAANEKNNVAGMMGKNGLRSYGSVEESIYDMARNLRQNYLNQGKTSVAEIGAKYAPVGAANDPTGLNNHWTTGVSRQLNKLT